MILHTPYTKTNGLKRAIRIASLGLLALIHLPF